MIHTDDLDMMVNRRGALDVFWRTLRRVRTEADPRASQRAVFEMLDAAFSERYGRPWFPSYDAFKKFLRRHARSV